MEEPQLVDLLGKNGLPLFPAAIVEPMAQRGERNVVLGRFDELEDFRSFGDGDCLTPGAFGTV